MGNTISDKNGELNNTQLNRFIIDWALNKYNDGISGDRFKNLLKKRACCTKQTSIPIGIPAVNEDIQKLEFSSVYIPIFASSNEITPEQCSFEPIITNGIPNKRLYYHTDKDGFIISNIECDPIYRELCSQVKRDRSRYLTDMERLYGPYADTKTVEIITSGSESARMINKENQYVDCNCKNSIYQSDLLSISANTDKLNPNTLAQSLDSRCSLNASRTFKLSDERVSNICLNTVQLTGDITQSDAAQLGLNQSCNLSTTNNTTVEAPVTSTTQFTPEQLAQLIAVLSAATNTAPPAPAPEPVITPTTTDQTAGTSTGQTGGTSTGQTDVTTADQTAGTSTDQTDITSTGQADVTTTDQQTSGTTTNGGVASANISAGDSYAYENKAVVASSNNLAIGIGIGILVLIIILLIYFFVIKKN